MDHRIYDYKSELIYFTPPIKYNIRLIGYKLTCEFGEAAIII